MHLRNAVIDDLPAIVDIYNSIIPGRKVTADLEFITVGDRLNWFHEHDAARRPLWVAEEDDKIIGWISFSDFYGRPAYNGTAEISIYLHEQHRGKGLGKRLMSQAIDECKNLQIHTLLGFIFEQNKGSLSLFDSFGFEEWGYLKDVAVLDNFCCSLKIMGLKIPQ
jgi:phosphinothricin acetyltransferase